MQYSAALTLFNEHYSFLSYSIRDYSRAPRYGHAGLVSVAFLNNFPWAHGYGQTILA